MLRLKDDEIFQQLDSASEALRTTEPIMAALKPPPGPYALFHHIVHAIERIGDVKTIFQRMLNGRTELSALTAQVRFDKDDPVLMGRRHETIQTLKLDYESLFHFGSVLLDQWSHVAGYLAGVTEPEDFVFHKLVQTLDQPGLPPVLSVVQQHLTGQARWLHFWMRTYRNVFVVHANRPWQRGSNFRVVGDDFALFTPSPPGWEDDEALASEIRGLLPHAPEWLQRAAPDHHERLRALALFARVVENIGTVDLQADRDHIASVARRAGIGTPTFQIVASGLADFVSRGTLLIKDTALAHPTTIKLGGRA